ncbi:MAG: ribose 5-phosphate isomerase B [Oscillospiraceae bacterium]|nr:ribose 5-phosphate isomerase B [Oscillospiraceae bacterium]
MIALACDHGGFELMGKVKAYLDNAGFKYKDFGTFSSESVDYPEYAVLAGQSIVLGDCARGIFICGTGIGMSVAANKIPGIRAALCFDNFMAQMARNHNDANVLCLGARVLSANTALGIIEVFLNSGFDGDRHARRVGMLTELDAARC